MYIAESRRHSEWPRLRGRHYGADGRSARRDEGEHTLMAKLKLQLESEGFEDGLAQGCVTQLSQLPFQSLLVESVNLVAQRDSFTVSSATPAGRKTSLG